MRIVQKNKMPSALFHSLVEFPIKKRKALHYAEPFQSFDLPLPVR